LLPILTTEHRLLTDFDTDLKTKLALETARIHWRELQPWFAKGHAISVAVSLDLVEVSFQLCQDNKAMFEAWMLEGLVKPVEDAEAQSWFERDTELWAVVVKPWVLVQDKPLQSH
jgi:hypothetical protein